MDETHRRRLAPLISAISLISGFFRLILKEVLSMDFSVFTLFRLLLQLVDPIMAVWMVAIWILGYWLKKLKLPRWCPPLPILLLLAYLVLGFIFGAIQSELVGWRGVAYVLLYGTGNGLLFTGLSFIVYDIVHGGLKKRKARKAMEAAEEVMA